MLCDHFCADLQYLNADGLDVELFKFCGRIVRTYRQSDQIVSGNC